MKRFLLILCAILICCGTVFFTSSLPIDTPGVRAEKGVLDLREADFASHIYGLDGQWEFYYDLLASPEELPPAPAKETEWIDLPGPWTRLGHPALGRATYRLTVLTGGDDPLLLYIPEIMSSARIWANGKMLYQAGTPDSSIPGATGVRNELLVVAPRDGRITFVVQAANYYMNGSGIFYHLLLGRDTVLLHRVWAPRMVVAAVLGGILLIGLYNMTLFLFRRREGVYLSFGVMCLMTVLRLAMESNAFVQYFRPGGVNFALSRVFLILFVLHSLSIMIFAMRAFSIRPGRILRALQILGAGIPILAILLLPYARAIVCMFLIMIPFIAIIVLSVRQWKKSKNPYQLLYLCSLAAFVVYGPLSKTLLEGEVFIPASVPNLFLVLCQCAMLSQSYARAHDEVERVNANLEGLVEQRTAELDQTNRRLSASQAALREMIGNISHDLKTPLTVLNNYLELLEDGAMSGGERERAEYLSIAYHKNLDLQRLIRNLFEVTRLEGGTASYRIQEIFVGQLLEEALQKYADQARDSGIAFTAVCDREDLTLWADGDKIWSVLDNLVYNALRHTPQGGSITLTARQSGERTEIRVADTGEGISPAHLPHIFERFYKASPARGEKNGSSGLGLYIVKTVTEAMGGMVAVESQPGKGAVFILTFPAE